VTRSVTHVVAFGGSRPILAAPVFAAWLGVPLITLIRGNDFDAAVFSTRRRPVLDQAFARSDLVCAVSQDKVDKIAALHPGIRVRWIPNGIDRSDWELAPSDRARARAWRAETLTDGQRVLGLFGQLKAKKGGVFLLDALLRSGSADAFHLLLAGWMEPELEAWLSEHDLPFTALPFLDRFELLPWYAACDWIAIPSFYDGLPNVLVEAAALGVPMLAARAGGMVDVVEDGRTAFMFDPGDEAGCAWAIQRAARLNEETRLEMGAACRLLAQSELDGELEITRYVDALSETRATALRALA
jgi:glycosyltransferase involved in cell wall biosynthesis